jgi:hypothetical protein
MSCQFPAICKVVARPVGKHLFPVNAVRRLRRRFRRNSATLAQRRSRSVRLCDKNGPFVTSGLPVPPKPLDLKALPTTLAIARASRKPFFVVLNDAPVQGREVQETADSLKQAGIEVSPVVLHNRKAFYSHMQIGETAEDFDPRGMAAGEARALTLWLCERMGILASGVKKSTNIQINRAGAAA